MSGSRAYEFGNSGIKDILFPDKLVVELNSTHIQQLPNTARVLANLAYHDRLMLSHLTEEDYLLYLDNQIGSWNINVLGLEGLTFGTIDKLFYRLSKCNNKVKALGIDNLLDDANEKSISLIYNNVVLWMSTQPAFLQSITYGVNFNSTWRTRFNYLSDPEFLANELKRITKNSFEVNFVTRNNRDHTVNQLNSSLAASQEQTLKQSQFHQAQILELVAKNQAMQQQLILQEEAQRELTARLATVSATVKTSLAEILVLEKEGDKKNEALTMAEDSLRKSTRKYKKYKNYHHLAEAELELANQRVNQLEIHTVCINTLLGELKQSRLFSVEPIVAESKADAEPESLPSTKKRISKKRKGSANLIDESLSFAANSLMHLHALPASTLEIDAKDEDKNESQTSDLHQKLQDTLLRLVTQYKLNVNQPDATFALYIEHEIKMCEKIFSEGKGFHEISSKEVSTVLYYLCFLVCNFHKKKNESTLRFPLNIHAYLNQTNVARTEDKKSLLHTLTRMSDAVIEVSEANMWLREGEIRFNEKIQKLNSQLTMAQASQVTHAASSSPSSSPAAFFSNSALPEEKKPSPARSENVTVTVTVSMPP